MEYFMHKLVLFALVALSLNAHAKTKSAPPKYYIDGKQVSLEQAVLSAAAGKEAMKCQPVELKETRTGLSLKAVKAEKTE
jgi:hypothetical protein